MRVPAAEKALRFRPAGPVPAAPRPAGQGRSMFSRISSRRERSEWYVALRLDLGDGRREQRRHRHYAGATGAVSTAAAAAAAGAGAAGRRSLELQNQIRKELLHQPPWLLRAKVSGE